MAISTNGTIIARLAGGLYNQTLSNASYNEMVGSVKSAADINALANSLVSTDFAGKTDAQIATVLLTNLGLTSVAGLNNWVAAQITAAGTAGKGAKIVSLLNDYSNLTADPVYGASASSFNGKVDSALSLSQTAGFKGGDINAAATIAAAEKAAADAAAAKIAADKAAADAAAAKAAAEKAAAEKAAAEKAAADKAAADKIAADAKAAADKAAADKIAADAKAAADKAAADKIAADAKAAADKAAADKIAADKAAAEKVLTDAADKAAADASAAIDAATVADAALTAAQTALTAATTKAALTDATVLASTTKTLTDAVTAATTAKTNADKAVVDANAAFTAALNAATPVAADVVNTNAAVLISTNKAAVAAKALADATAAAALAKTVSDAATADDASAVTAQTAVDTSAAAATKAAAAAVASVATSKTAAAATAVTTDDAVATAATTVAAAKGAGAAKVVSDAKAAAEKAIADKAIADKAIADKALADKAIADKAIADKAIADKAIADKAIADKAIADKAIADKAIADKAIADKAIADKAIADKAIADKAIADKIIADALAAENAPQTLLLTTGINNFTGKSGNDIFDGSLSGTNMTLNNFDSLTGGAGTDTLYGVINAAVTVQPTANSVETVSVQFTGAGTYSAFNTPNVTTVENTNSSAAGIFTNINSTAVALKDSGTNQNVTYGFTAAAVAGSADSATLSLSNVTGGTVTISGVETMNIVSNDAPNTIDASGIAATTVNVSGSQSTTMGTLNVATTTLNGGSATGALSATLAAVPSATVTGSQGADTITVSAVTGNVVVNTGAGNDNIIAATNLTVTDTIDGGAGTADKLTTTNTIADALDAATPTTTKVSNIEQLEITNAFDNAGLVLANISAGIDTVNLTVAGGSIMTGGDAISSPSTSLSVNLGSFAAGNTTGALAGGGTALTVTNTGSGASDSLSIVNRAGNSTTTLNIDVFANQSITSSGYENVTLNTGAVANGAAQTTATITINADAAASPTSYTAAGTNALTTTSLVTNSTGLLTVNASGMTAQPAGTATLTISGTTSGTAGTQSITGSGGDDSITIGAFAATIAGGAGDDTIVGGSASNNLSGGDGNDTLTGGAANDVISGGAGNDAITANAGVDNLTGGDGNDTFVLAGNLTSADTIDGGAGTNTLSVVAGASVSSSIFANVTNVQQVALTGTGTATLAAPLSSSTTTFDLSSAEATTLVLATGYTGATTVLQTNGTASNGTNIDVITNTANVALTVQGKVADLNTVSITGGTGTDALILTADSGSADLTNTSSIDSITMVAGATPTATAVLSNAVSATGRTLAVDASAMTNTAATFGFSGKASQAGGVNVTGASTAVNTITLTNFAGANSVTGGSGADSITSGSGTDSLAGGAGNDAYIFSTRLLNTDVVSDSAGTADTLNATINGLTATTGALNIAGVETLNLATVTAASTINALGISGATNINVNALQNVTLTNLPAGTNLGLGTTASAGIAAVGGYTGTATFSLANSTGSADAITVNLRGAADADTNATLVAAAGIETVTIAGGTVAGTLNVSGVVAPTITVTGGATTKTLALGTLNAATTTFNAPAFLGKLTATGSDSATTYTIAGAEAHNITAGGGNDTITISAVGTTVQTIAGGAGTDTLNMTLNNTTFSMTSVSAVENVNLTLGNNSAHAPGANVQGFNTAELVNINVTGGNTLSTFTAGTAIGSGAGFKTFNASAVPGVVDVTFATAAMNLGATITGGSGSTDVIRYTDAGAVNTAVTLAGFEKLVATSSTDDTGGINLANATGLSSVEVNGTHTYTINNLASGVAVGVGNAATALTDGKGVTVALASTSGTADALTFNLVNTGGAAGTTLTANGVETITLNQSTTVAATAMGLLIRDTNAVNPVGLVLNGGIAASAGGVQDVTFLSTALETNVATINGATFAGNMIMADGSRTGTTAMTITGGSGVDTVIMKHTNDVLEGGSGTSDTLKIVQNAVLGGFLVDLSSTTDQVTTYNGAANASIQKGFEHVNLSGITGNFGADITARSGGSVIVATANADQITGGAGVDTITGGAGADVINGGEGNDVFIIVGTAQAAAGNAAIDLIDGGAGTGDELRLSTATTIAATDVLTRITNVEKITSDANAGIVSLTLTTAGLAGTAFTIVDLSGDTDATSSNVVDLSNGDAATGITAVTGGAGIETITLGGTSTAATLIGGGGVDVFVLAATNNSTIAYAAAADIAGNNTIGGFTAGSDKLAFGSALVTGAAAGALSAAQYAETAVTSTAGDDSAAVGNALNLLGTIATAKVFVIADGDGGAQTLTLAELDAGLTASNAVGAGFVLAVLNDAAGTAVTLYYDPDFNATGTGAGTAGQLILVGTITASAVVTIAGLASTDFSFI